MNATIDRGGVQIVYAGGSAIGTLVSGGIEQDAGRR